MLRISAFSIGLAVLAGCGGGGGQAREPGEVAAQYQGDLMSADTARGETVYNNVCMSCHGAGAPALDGLGWNPGQMRQQVREGSGRMPAINEGRVSAEDLEAVLAFMTTTGAVAAELPGGTAGGEAPVEGAPAEEGAEPEATP